MVYIFPIRHQPWPRGHVRVACRTAGEKPGMKTFLKSLTKPLPAATLSDLGQPSKNILNLGRSGSSSPASSRQTWMRAWEYQKRTKVYGRPMMIEHACRARRPPSPGSPEKAWHALKSKHLSSDLHPKAGRIQKYYQILTKIIKTYQDSVEQNQGRHFLENKKSNANILAKGLGSGGAPPNIYIHIYIYSPLDSPPIAGLK